MNTERRVAETLWPADAEILTERDWQVLAKSSETGASIRDSVQEPPGEAKDAFLASLLAIYWTMRIAHLALQIAREVEHLHGKERTEAILSKLLSFIDDTTPRRVVDRVTEILAELGLASSH